VGTASANPREQHLAFVGIMLLVDDPFWSTHFPPNGWGCKCSVRQITRFEYQRLAATGDYLLEPPTIETRPFINRRTGEVTYVPVGIDPGWGTNPGLSRAKTLVQNVSARLEAAGEDAARTRIGEIVSSEAMKILLGMKERLMLPVAVAPRIASALRARASTVMATNDVIKLKTEKAGVDVRVEDFAALQDYLDRGEVVDEGQKGKRTVLIDDGGRLIKIVVQASEAGYLRITTIFTTSRRKIKGRGGRRGGRDAP
jgi:hypothetical protein